MLTKTARQVSRKFLKKVKISSLLRSSRLKLDCVGRACISTSLHYYWHRSKVVAFNSSILFNRIATSSYKYKYEISPTPFNALLNIAEEMKNMS